MLLPVSIGRKVNMNTLGPFFQPLSICFVVLLVGKIHYLKSVQNIPVTLEEAWSFFSDPRNLLKLTPAFLNLKITNQLFGDEVYAGQVMTYTVKPLFGMSVSWMTEITHVERHKRFIDEQRKGHFKAINGGVEMTDLVHYRLPFNFLGEIAHAVTVRKKLTEIFTYRYFKINELFGDWPGSTMRLQIE